MEFLKANRFWALILLCAAVYLKSVGFALDATALADFLINLTGGFLGVRTIDRFSEKFGKK